MSDKKDSKLSLSAKAKKFDVSLSTLKTVYKRGVAAWNSGHRPGTTPQQWGHARVNSFLRKGKTYHTADKDLRESNNEDVNTLFERLIFVDADESQIQSATKLKKSGSSKQEIWQKTGAFQHPQTGRWRKEISDDQLAVNIPLTTKVDVSGKIKDLITHDKLYSEIPQIKDKNDIQIVVDNPEDLYNRQQSRERGTVLQGYYEHPIEDEVVKKIKRKEQGKPFDISYPIRNLIAAPRKIIRDKLNLDRGTIFATGHNANSALDVVVHELQHAANFHQGLPRGQVGSSLGSDKPDTKSSKNDDFNDFLKYYRNPGETEARAAAVRRKLTPQERKERYPGYDYNPERLYFPTITVAGKREKAARAASTATDQLKPTSDSDGLPGITVTKKGKKLDQLEPISIDSKKKKINEGINTLFERLIFTDADESQIQSATELQKSGSSKEEIWQKTGAFQHPQTGRWLQEPISDDQLELKKYKQQGILSDLGVGAEKQPKDWDSSANVMKHDQLFKRFPQLAALPAVTQSLTPGQSLATSKRGRFTSWGGRRTGGIQVMSPTESGAKDAAVHELQHAVQYLQGRDSGANPETFKQQGSNEFMSKVKYYMDPGENEARAAAARRKLTPQERKERYPGKDFGFLNMFEDKNLNEVQLVGTDEYRKHAIAMTPGQTQEIEDAFPPETYGYGIIQNDAAAEEVEEIKDKKEVNEQSGSGIDGHNVVSFKELRKFFKEQEEIEDEEEIEQDEYDEEETEDDGVEDGVDFTPSLKNRKIKNKTGVEYTGATNNGLPVLGIAEDASMTSSEWEKLKGNKPEEEDDYTVDLTKLNEAIDYHNTNNLSLIENVYRPGSEMFFAMIFEAKRLYAEGKYIPKDEYEKDLLESDIGEVAEYEGVPVLLDYPYEEQEINEEDDPTRGKGIGKPFRSRGGGAVYVKNEKGNVIKVNFSQSGMKKRFNEPARVKSFVARHNCYGNKDRTSASYWACRWPRYFSDTGQKWW